MNPEAVDVTAGLGGFLAFFLLAVALYFLMRNMNGRLRRMAYREQQEAEAAAGQSTPDSPDSPDSSDSPDSPDSQENRGDAPQGRDLG